MSGREGGNHFSRATILFANKAFFLSAGMINKEIARFAFDGKIKASVRFLRNEQGDIRQSCHARFRGMFSGVFLKEENWFFTEPQAIP